MGPLQVPRRERLLSGTHVTADPNRILGFVRKTLLLRFSRMEVVYYERLLSLVEMLHVLKNKFQFSTTKPEDGPRRHTFKDKTDNSSERKE